MNEANFVLAAALVDTSYVRQAQEGRAQREKLVKVLLSQVIYAVLLTVERDQSQKPDGMKRASSSFWQSLQLWTATIF